MKRWEICFGFCMLGFFSGPLANGADQAAPTAIELTLVDDEAIAFATFQSHNQKVVSNQNGIFITYIHKSNNDYTAQQWRLACVAIVDLDEVGDPAQLGRKVIRIHVLAFDFHAVDGERDYLVTADAYEVYAEDAVGVLHP